MCNHAVLTPAVSDCILGKFVRIIPRALCEYAVLFSGRVHAHMRSRMGNNPMLTKGVHEAVPPAEVRGSALAPALVVVCFFEDNPFTVRDAGTR